MSLLDELFRERDRIEDAIEELNDRLSMVNRLIDDTLEKDAVFDDTLEKDAVFDEELPTDPLNTWYIPSKTHYGVEYTVVEHRGGYYTCSCPDYVYRSLDNVYHQCKHIDEVKDNLWSQAQLTK